MYVGSPSGVRRDATHWYPPPPHTQLVPAGTLHLLQGLFLVLSGAPVSGQSAQGLGAARNLQVHLQGQPSWLRGGQGPSTFSFTSFGRALDHSHYTDVEESCLVIGRDEGLNGPFLGGRPRQDINSRVLEHHGRPSVSFGEQFFDTGLHQV